MRNPNLADGGEQVQTFAKKRSESEVEQDRAQRVGKASRAAGIYEAESPIQGLYIFLDEPESSTGARVFSLLIVTAIMASSVSFVAETHSYVRTRALPRALFSLRVHARELLTPAVAASQFKDDPSCHPVYCDAMEMQAHPDQCAEVSGCAYTYSSCISAAAGTCNVTDLHDNRTACVGTPGCGHSSVETCAEPVFNACAAGCDLVEASGGDVAACMPTPGNCAYASVQCDGADMQEGQDVCEEDEACVWSLGFCGAEAVCLGTGWPAELSGSDSVSNSDDDLARQTMCEETSGCYYSNTLATMHLIEAICILLFSVEYVLKLLSCSQRPDKPMGKDGLPRNPAAETMSWATETMNFIDLLAILPWWLSKMTSSEMNIGSPILRMFRMVRVFRILKFGGHVRNLQLFAIGMKRAQEGLMLLLFLLILYLCVFAAVLYQLEYDAQREAGNSGFTSIPTT